MELGLSRIGRLVREHDKVLPWKAIHIAGTNGKGTTSRYVEALLEQSNVAVGLFNSPHLLERRDCIRIAGRPVHRQTFDRCEALVKQRNADGRVEATAFELLTATAFECFAKAKVDVAIVECGLGGRLDATNVLRASEVVCSVITRIGLDHQDLLGDTVEEIAGEKAGIIKPGVPVVVDGSNLLAVKQVIKQRARDLQCGLTVSPVPQSDDYLVNNRLLAETVYRVAVKRIGKIVPRFKLQPESNSRARRLRLLSESSRSRVLDSASKGFGGRFQKLRAWTVTGHEHGYIILDGAHNEQAGTALRYKVDQELLHSQQRVAETEQDMGVRARRRPASVTWVLAMSSSKRGPDEFLKALVRPTDRIVFCEFGPVDGMPWVRPQVKEVLASLAQDDVVPPQSVQVADSVEQALRLAGQMASQDGSQIVVSGSLYLVADVLRLVKASQRQNL